MKTHAGDDDHEWQFIPMSWDNGTCFWGCHCGAMKRVKMVDPTKEAKRK